MGATFMLMMMVQGGPSTTRRLLAESGFSGLIRAHLLLFNFCFYRMEAFFAEQAQGTRVVGFSDLGAALHFREIRVRRGRDGTRTANGEKLAILVHLGHLGSRARALRV